MVGANAIQKYPSSLENTQGELVKEIRVNLLRSIPIHHLSPSQALPPFYQLFIILFHSHFPPTIGHYIFNFHLL